MKKETHTSDETHDIPSQEWLAQHIKDSSAQWRESSLIQRQYGLGKHNGKWHYMAQKIRDGWIAWMAGDDTGQLCRREAKLDARETYIADCARRGVARKSMHHRDGDIFNADDTNLEPRRIADHKAIHSPPPNEVSAKKAGHARRLENRLCKAEANEALRIKYDGKPGPGGGP